MADVSVREGGAFEQRLAREILTTERFRVTLLAVIPGLSMLLFLAVGAAYTVTVGHAMNTSVGSTCTLDVAELLEIRVGNSMLRMHQDGTITLSGKRINIEAEGPLKLIGKDIENN